MDIVIIANAWCSAADNPTGKHQLALQFAAKGHRVLWIEGSGMRQPQAGSATDRARILTKLKSAFSGIRRTPEGIYTVAPLILPIPTNPAARALNAAIYLLTGLVGVLWLRFRRPPLLNFLPVVPLVEVLWPWRTVYYCVDRWDRFSHYDSRVMEKVDTACCQHANGVLATSRNLMQRCAQINPATQLIGHGVDIARFRASLTTPSLMQDRPSSLPTGRLVGFFGLLSNWIDQDLIVALARALEAGRAGPEAHLVLIGPHDIDLTKLQAIPRLHMGGPVPYNNLPAYAACFSVGIIPFIINELTEAVNPVKLREMLAAGMPVVSTALPEVAALAPTNPHIVIASDTETFITDVCQHLLMPLTLEDRLAISRTVEHETWSTKADDVITVLSGHTK